jgi:hypothetical protein
MTDNNEGLPTLEYETECHSLFEFWRAIARAEHQRSASQQAPMAPMKYPKYINPSPGLDPNQPKSTAT